MLFDDGTELSCATLLDRAERLAGGMRGRVAKQDRVVLAVGNRAEFLIAYLALLAHRAIPVTVSPRPARPTPPTSSSGHARPGDRRARAGGRAG